jgi:hypothetical protein
MFLQECISELATDQAAHNDWVLAQVDVTNAFNCLDRSVMLQQAAQRAPHLMPWLSGLYGSPLPLLVKGSSDKRIIWSRRGPQQGCPFGTLLFALGIQPQIEALTGLWVNTWYADDGVLAGPTAAVEAALHQLTITFATIGLQLNLGKCVTWGPGMAIPNRVGLLLHQTKLVPWAPGSGVVILGTPVVYPDVSMAFANTFWLAKGAESRALLRKISAIGHSQSEHALIRACGDVTRINHLLRSSSTVGLDHHLARFQADLLEATEALVAHSLTPDQSTQVFLPTRLGGLGLRSHCYRDHRQDRGGFLLA